MNASKAFLSYSRTDNDLRERISTDLSTLGCNLWIDQIDIPVGQQWDKAIEDAINACDDFVVLLSEHSSTSDIVLDEVNYALEQKKRVIPVIIENCRVPLRLRRLESLDIQGDYDKTLKRLSMLINSDATGKIDSTDKTSPSFAYHPGQKHSPSIVVLPFESLAEDSRNTIFSDGLLTGIVSGLAHNKELFVIASGTARTYRGKTIDTRQVARELRVTYLVMGQLTILNGQLRVSCELISARNGRVVWNESFDRELSDVFDIQDQIARSVTHQVLRSLGGFEYNRVKSMRPDDMNAWELLQRAMYYGWSQDWLLDSIGLLEKSISMEESLAEAHALLAARLAYMMWYGDFEKVARSMEHAQRALSLAPESSVCLLCSSVAYNVNGKTEVALKQVEHALEINPNLADAWAYNGLYLGTIGRNDEALEMLAYALELSPKDPIRYLWYAHQVICYANKDDYGLALEACVRSTSLNADWFWSRMAQAQSEAMLGMSKEARLSWSEAKKLNPVVSIENMAVWLQGSALSDQQQSSVINSLKQAGCT